ncbi:MAG: response regulator [Desulfococcaceae bacterium]
MTDSDGTPRILIVDDDPGVLRVLGEILGAEYRRLAARSGERALRIIAADPPPDLILLDVVMPGMDGYEVCRRLKASSRTRDIPVIFITALANAADERRGLEEGAVDFLSKPINPMVVRARVRTHLALLQARRELEAKNRELREAACLREDVERMARHDLKSPLNAIIGLPDLIRAAPGELTEKQLKYLETIKASGYRMLNMINASLDLFKMERGIYRFEPGKVDLVSVIGRILHEWRDPDQTAPQPPVDLRLGERPAGAAEPFWVHGEELLCYTMLSNLIGNALEASPKGERATVILENGDRPAVRVRNRGAVAPEIRDRFFEKYATFGKRRGTGLGTYSARLIAEVHGGEIWLDTSEEGFTTVGVRFGEMEAEKLAEENGVAG